MAAGKAVCFVVDFTVDESRLDGIPGLGINMIIQKSNGILYYFGENMWEYIALFRYLSYNKKYSENIFRQNKRNLVTQSYRVFHMTASCNLLSVTKRVALLFIVMAVSGNMGQEIGRRNVSIFMDTLKKALVYRSPINWTLLSLKKPSSTEF